MQPENSTTASPYACSVSLCTTKQPWIRLEITSPAPGGGPSADTHLSFTDAQFKFAHDRIEHTLSELENLYLRPFRQQALKRHRERHTDPKRQDWRAEAILADDQRDGEQTAVRAAAGHLVFDGTQTSLGVVSAASAEASLAPDQTRKRTATDRARTLWPERPVKRVARQQPTQWRHFTRGGSADSDRTWNGDDGEGVAGQETASPLNADEAPGRHGRDLGHEGPTSARVYWHRRSPGLLSANDGSRAGFKLERYLPQMHLATAKRPPVLHRPIIRSDSPETIPSSLDMGSASEGVPTAAQEGPTAGSKSLSPFSSRSTLESAGATLAPASTIDSIQPISSGETSPKLRVVNGVPPARTTYAISSTSFPAFTFPDTADADMIETPCPFQPRPSSANRGSRTLAKVPDRSRSASVAAPSGPQKSSLLVAQPSFSALPPVPPLPFDTVPVVVPFPLRPAARTDSLGANVWGWQPTSSGAGDDRFGPAFENGQYSAASSQKERPCDLVDFSSSPGWPSLSSRLPESGERDNRTGSNGATIDAGTSRPHVRFEAFERVGIGDRPPPREAVEPYPPLSQETVLDSGASQDVADAATSDEAEEPPRAQGQERAATASEADEDTQETQDSQFSVDD